jgi:2-iminobutanoate/2-iminopropanoate deaminase
MKNGKRSMYDEKESNRSQNFDFSNERMFFMETIYTKTAPDAIGPYSQAIKVGNTLYSSGQIAINPATGKVEAADIEGQSRQVMQNLAEVLKAAGASFDNVVKTTCFLKDVAKDFAAFNEIYAEAMGDNKPARSCVGVAELPKGVLVEVEVIAVLD